MNKFLQKTFLFFYIMTLCFFGNTVHAGIRKDVSELLKQGYELKAVVKEDNVLYFQKGSSLYVCFFSDRLNESVPCDPVTGDSSKYKSNN